MLADVKAVVSRLVELQTSREVATVCMVGLNIDETVTISRNSWNQQSMAASGRWQLTAEAFVQSLTSAETGNADLTARAAHFGKLQTSTGCQKVHQVADREIGRRKRIVYVSKKKRPGTVSRGPLKREDKARNEHGSLNLVILSFGMRRKIQTLGT